MANLRCIHCAAAAAELWTRESRVIRLKKCLKCGNVVDPYVEFEGTVKLVDLILLRPEVIRHFVFNYEQTWIQLARNFYFSLLIRSLVAYRFVGRTTTTTDNTVFQFLKFAAVEFVVSASWFLLIVVLGHLAGGCIVVARQKLPLVSLLRCCAFIFFSLSAFDFIRLIWGFRAFVLIEGFHSLFVCIGLRSIVCILPKSGMVARVLSYPLFFGVAIAVRLLADGWIRTHLTDLVFGSHG